MNMKTRNFMKTGQADLPLHYGKMPSWLYERMVKLARPISEAIILEHGQDEFLKRLSDPFFFQAFGCVLGFDWHSSGLTTTMTAALKEAINKAELGIRIAGGKGKTSKKTPEEIEKFSEQFNLPDTKVNELIYSSKISAKVDNAMLQDGYDLYHHIFIFTEKGKWCVVQQGMNQETNYARRYHWLSHNIKSFVEEPHEAIIADKKENKVMDLTSKESRETRNVSLDLVKEPNYLKKFNNKSITKIQKITQTTAQTQKTLFDFSPDLEHLQYLKLPQQHFIINLDEKILQKIYELQPESYEELLMIKGVGKKTLRALSLISSLIYGTKISWKDPAVYSYAHGGKDGIPYPVNKKIYDKSIEVLEQAIESARINSKEKLKMLRKIKLF